MAEFIGIKNVPPTYPIKPVQPGSRDRKSDKRKKDLPTPDANEDDTGERGETGGAGRPGDDDKPSIDEYV